MARSALRTGLGIAALSLSAFLAGCGIGPWAGDTAPPPRSAPCVVDSPTSGKLTIGNPLPDAVGPSGPLPRVIPGAPHPGSPNADQWLHAEPVVVDSDSATYGFTGDGVVHWRLARVDIAIRTGVDEQVPVIGRCIVQVDFATAKARDGAGPPARIDRDAPSLIADVTTYPSHGDQQQSFLGARGTAVRTVAGPTSIRIEVR